MISKNGDYKKFFKPDSKYTILLIAPVGSIIKFRALASKSIKSLSLYSQVDDVIARDELITYELTINDEWLDRVKTNTLWFMLTVYSGNPDIYVHPDSLPSDLKNYRWNSTADDTEDLSIPAEERTQYTNNKFYIR